MELAVFFYSYFIFLMEYGVFKAGLKVLKQWVL